jgi:hypothetical protein
MNKKVLLLCPHERTRILFQSNRDVIFLDDRGWSVYDSSTSKRHLTKIDDIEVNYTDDNNFKLALEKMDWWAPIWHRWVANADQYELHKREALFYMLKISAGLNFFDIKTLIFPTGTSHHVDTSLIEIACSLRNIKQIFLYPNAFNGRLLPMIQSESISDRRPLGERISQYDSTEDIMNLQNKGAPKSKRATIYKTNSTNHNFYLAIYRLIRFQLRTYLVKLVKYFLKIENLAVKPLFQVPPLIIFDHFRLMRQQQKALNFYLDNCMSREEVQKNLENKSSIPLIAAHYQPEATSFPEGGDWSNHVDVVLRLRNLKIKGDIVYKEHPASWTFFEPIVGSTRVGMYRSISYYQQLLDLGCKFLTPDYDLKIQRKKSSWYLPISITGTLCVERSLAGLPSIYTGYPIYKDLPGAHSMDSIENYPEFYETVQIENQFKTDDVIEHLSKMFNYTTITNVLGIGNGLSIHDEKKIRAFNSEYIKLVEYLLAN